MKRQKAAIVGAGQIAKQHLGALAQIDTVDVVCVCDLSPIMAESTADRFGVPAFTTDYRGMLEAHRPDVVHITTPPASHFLIARDAIEAHAHVFVEKPITTSLAELVEIQQLAADRGRWVVEDHNYRFNHDVLEVMRLLGEGKLGEVRHVDVELNLEVYGAGSRFADPDLPHPAMREPLSTVSDFVTHLVYLAQVFVGPHCEVSSVVRRELPELPDAITDFKVLAGCAQGTATLRFSSMAQPDAFTLRVQGSQMDVSLNLFECGLVTTEVVGGPKPLAPVRNMRRRGASEKRNAWRSLSRKLSGGPGPYEGLWRLIAETYDALATGGPPPVTPDEIRSTMEMVAAIERCVTEKEAPRCVS